jgi:hypothetical protein
MHHKGRGGGEGWRRGSGGALAIVLHGGPNARDYAGYDPVRQAPILKSTLYSGGGKCAGLCWV